MKKYLKLFVFGAVSLFNMGLATAMQELPLLYEAAKNGDEASLQQLTIDVNRTDEDGWAALHYAVENGSEEMVKWLLGHGADTNLVNGDGMSPLAKAVMAENISIVQLLLENGAHANTVLESGIGLFFYAVGQKNLELVRLLLEHGADVEARTFSWTPLYWAIEKEDQEMVRLLLAHGANPLAGGVAIQIGFLISAGNETPLDLATRIGNQIIIGMLRDYM